jgi:hypothetical protein
MGLELGQGYGIERFGMRGLKVHRRGDTGLKRFSPTQGA